jgi:hypothetical protein
MKCMSSAPLAELFEFDFALHLFLILTGVVVCVFAFLAS